MFLGELREDNEYRLSGGGRGGGGEESIEGSPTD